MIAPGPAPKPVPYYSEGGYTIYHGDCAVIAPLLGRFDLLCTDPPYGIGEARGKDRSTFRPDPRSPHLGRKRIASGRDKYGSSTWDDSPPSDELLAMLIGAAKHACIFGGNYFSLPPSPCWLVWDKENGASDFADAELAWTNYTGAVRLKRHQWNGMLRGGVAGKEAEPRYHPTQKPLLVMSWAISLCPDQVTSIFDPFLGSGTTLRAAKNRGVKSGVGIEREERYCEIAANRLRQEVLL